MNSAAEFEQYLHRHIPLSRAMDIRVLHYDGLSLQLAAPLALNHNDKGSAFAGSIGSLASLAGWGLMMLWSQELGECQAAIAKAEIQYRRPLLTDLTALACLPGAADIAHFRQAFALHGRGKMPVRIEVCDRQGAGAVQEAVYAVWRMAPPAV